MEQPKGHFGAEGGHFGAQNLQHLGSPSVSICSVICCHLLCGLNIMSGLVALSSCAAVTLILFVGGSEVVLLVAAAVARGGVIVVGGGRGDGIIGTGAGEGVVGGALMMTFFIKRGSGDLLSTMLLRKDSGTR